MKCCVYYLCFPIELCLRSRVSDLSSLQGLVVVFIIPSLGFRRKCQGRGDAFHLIHSRRSATYFHMQPTELPKDISIESIRLSFCMHGHSRCAVNHNSHAFRTLGMPSVARTARQIRPVTKSEYHFSESLQAGITARRILALFRVGLVSGKQKQNVPFVDYILNW